MQGVGVRHIGVEVVGIVAEIEGAVALPGDASDRRACRPESAREAILDAPVDRLQFENGALEAIRASPWRSVISFFSQSS